MKKVLVFLLAAVSLTALGRDYKNVSAADGHTFYFFRLEQKEGNSVGFFVPMYNRIDYVPRVVGGGLSSRGGGGGKIIHETVRSSDEENRVIIIVGYNLSKMVDGDKIELKKGQVLYQIGSRTNRRGRTYAVYSFNKNDRLDRYFPPQGGTPPAVGAPVTRCPHCGKEIQLVPVKR